MERKENGVIMLRHLSATAFVALVTLPQAIAEAAPDPRKIMDKADAIHRIPIAEIYNVKMVLQKSGASAREREYSSVRLQDDKNGDKVRVNFSSPPNIRGTALLTLENRSDGKRAGEDDQWLYLSAFKRTRRVGAAELGDRFMASDIFYEDLKRRHVEDYEYEYLRAEKLDGKDCYVIEAKPGTPRVKKQSPYGKTLIWVRKDIGFIVKMRHFDKRGDALKEIVWENPTKFHEKAYRASKIVLTDVQRKHRTTLVIQGRKLVKNLDRETFAQKTLGRLTD